ncbi:hypothetical protein PROFUN_15444 [Planoprotostelium fungivorum]|uniref:Uncharacterized protein n=1 Tax=Planoprotostelium fungivorum TaxID=1890364 RepID=A0A2P6MW30_9EUKA|nr:hypothetical protein PROFUN_15444 [Planoprotostelium fungivorum]
MDDPTWHQQLHPDTETVTSISSVICGAHVRSRLDIGTQEEQVVHHYQPQACTRGECIVTVHRGWCHNMVFDIKETQKLLKMIEKQLIIGMVLSEDLKYPGAQFEKAGKGFTKMGSWDSFLRFLLDVVTRAVLALKSATRSGLLDRLSSAYEILGLPISLSYIQDRLDLVLLFTVNYDRRWSWSLSTYQCVLHVRREK